MGDVSPPRKRRRRKRARKSEGSPVGRPTRLSKEIAEAIIENLRAGVHASVAAAAAGISTSTYYHWLQRGKKGQAPFAKFWRDVRQARAAAEADAVKIIANAAMENWQAAAWFLERKHAKRWAKKDRTEHVVQGAKAGGVVVQIVEANGAAADAPNSPEPPADGGAPGAPAGE